MNVSCLECRSVFRVDPAKVPLGGVRARCSVCGGVIPIAAADFGEPARTPAVAAPPVAAPVAQLYEQTRVKHVGAFPALEEELMALGCDDGGASPDRADALVWALTDLMLGKAQKRPRVRVL